RRPGADRAEVSAGDGSLRIRMRAIAGAPLVAIRSARGTLVGRDHLVEIFEPGASVRPDRAVVAPSATPGGAP
ncbi:MAG: hypothetical protein P1P87_14645, partial [Trueperaceae bacterium]|nr:hypothetical protein [Trueperaceae bacterium]